VKFALIENGKGTQAVHDTVTAYRAAQRSGTAKHQERSAKSPARTRNRGSKKARVAPAPVPSSRPSGSAAV
jgi:large subunit ribosomal protein L4